MIDRARFELKYQLNFSQYLRIRSRLQCFAGLDPYSLAAESNKYFVRSLYFDTYDYRAYVEKMTGEGQRLKLRIRTYNASKESASFVSVELKGRWHNYIIKYSKHEPMKNYENFMKTGRWEEDDPVLDEFERIIRLRQLKPKVLVDYNREAYVAKDRSSVRVTFDHSMRYAQADSLFPDNAFFRKKDPYLVVLEIKVKEHSPLWLEGLIKEFDLKSVPNSKYTLGIEQTQHAMFI